MVLLALALYFEYLDPHRSSVHHVKVHTDESSNGLSSEETPLLVGDG